MEKIWGDTPSATLILSREVKSGSKNDVSIFL